MAARNANILETIGRTPVVRINKLAPAHVSLYAKLEAFNPILGKSGSLTERVTRSQTVAEDLTLNQREVVLYNLLDDAMKDLNARLERSIPQYLAPLLR